MLSQRHAAVSSNTKTWLREPRFQIDYNGQTRQETHVFLNGGKVYISEADREEFLRRYACDVWHLRLFPDDPQYHNYICEIRSEPCTKMYFDLDIVGTLTSEEFYTICRHIIRAVGVFCRSGKAAVCHGGTSEKTVKHNDTEVKLDKTGGHIVFDEGVIVSSADAIFLRNAAVQFLIHTLGEREPPLNSWSDVVDASVYGPKKSLRMIGSYKTQKCSECAGKTAKAALDCLCCSGTRRMSVPRVYEFRQLFDMNGVFLEAETTALLRHTKIVDVLRLCSIQTTKASTVSIVSPFPAWLAFDTVKFKEMCRDGKAKSSNSSVLNSLRQIDMVKGDDVKLSDEQIAKLKQYITEKVPQYDGISFRSIKRSATGSVITILTDGQYCANVGRCHNREHIYFVIKNGCMYQKCHCKCATTEGRFYGQCRLFSCPINGYDKTPEKLPTIIRSYFDAGLSSATETATRVRRGSNSSVATNASTTSSSRPTKPEQRALTREEDDEFRRAEEQCKFFSTPPPSASAKKAVRKKRFAA